MRTVGGEMSRDRRAANGAQRARDRNAGWDAVYVAIFHG